MCACLVCHWCYRLFAKHCRSTRVRRCMHCFKTCLACNYILLVAHMHCIRQVCNRRKYNLHSNLTAVHPSTFFTSLDECTLNCAGTVCFDTAKSRMQRGYRIREIWTTKRRFFRLLLHQVHGSDEYQSKCRLLKSVSRIQSSWLFIYAREGINS